jgi:hypothetical protein
MSTNPPQPPYQPPPPPPGGQPPADDPNYGGAQPPGADPQLDAQKKKDRKVLIGVIVGALVLIIGAFFFGQSQEKAKYEAGQPAYNEIYKKGAESGAVAGNEQGQKQGKKEGVAEGTEQGKKEGLDQGVEQGVAKGEAQGADAALGGLSGWNTNTPYVVTFTTNDNPNVPVSIDSRTLMQAGTNYKICDSGKGVCQSSATASTSSDGGPTP